MSTTLLTQIISLSLFQRQINFSALSNMYYYTLVGIGQPKKFSQIYSLSPLFVIIEAINCDKGVGKHSTPQIIVSESKSIIVNNNGGEEVRLLSSFSTSTGSRDGGRANKHKSSWLQVPGPSTAERIWILGPTYAINRKVLR